MSSRPVIFISSVSKELHSARDLVAKTLLALGHEPRWEDISATDQGDLLSILRKWIDESDAVIQIVGHCYGLPVKDPDPKFGPCSHTQYEAHYARQQGKPVYYILTDDTFPIDGCACEPKTLHQLQEKYRQQVKSYGDLYHPSSSLLQTELLIRRMEDKLAALRKRDRQFSSLVLGLLLVLVIGGFCVVEYLRIENKRLAELSQQNQKMQDAMADLQRMLASLQGGSAQKLSADYNDALQKIAQKHNLNPATFRTFLSQKATQALGNPTLPATDKVRALQFAGQFVQARDIAVEHASKLETGGQKNSTEAMALWTEAARTENSLGNPLKGQEYAIKANLEPSHPVMVQTQRMLMLNHTIPGAAKAPDP